MPKCPECHSTAYRLNAMQGLNEEYFMYTCAKCQTMYNEKEIIKMSDVKYPQVKVELVGQDGNAFSIMGRAAAAARKAGLSKDVIDAYRNEAMSGDYDNLLATTMEWFDCDSIEDDDDVDPDADYDDEEYDDLDGDDDFSN